MDTRKIVLKIPYDDYNGVFCKNPDICGTVVPQFSRFAHRNGYKIVETYIKYKGRILKEGDGLYLFNSSDFDHGSLEGISRCLKASKHDAGVVTNMRIRKFTPRECFRLMGLDEPCIDRIQGVIPLSQQYKMAGNSIVVDTLACIFRKLFVDVESGDKQLSLF